jgi:hypothetical protein
MPTTAPSERTIQLSVKINPTMHQRLIDLGETEGGTPVAALIRRAVLRFLEAEEREQA